MLCPGKKAPDITNESVIDADARHRQFGAIEIDDADVVAPKSGKAPKSRDTEALCKKAR